MNSRESSDKQLESFLKGKQGISPTPCCTTVSGKRLRSSSNISDRSNVLKHCSVTFSNISHWTRPGRVSNKPANKISPLKFWVFFFFHKEKVDLKEVSKVFFSIHKTINTWNSPAHQQASGLQSIWHKLWHIWRPDGPEGRHDLSDSSPQTQLR